MALEDLLTGLAQPRPVLLQALLNSEIIVQLLPAKALCIARARSLLFGGTHMALSEGERNIRRQQQGENGQSAHKSLKVEWIAETATRYDRASFQRNSRGGQQTSSTPVLGNPACGRLSPRLDGVEYRSAHAANGLDGL